MTRRQRRLCLALGLGGGLLFGTWLGGRSAKTIYEVGWWDGRREGWRMAQCVYRDGGRLLDDGSCYVPPGRWR